MIGVFISLKMLSVEGVGPSLDCLLDDDPI
jgi:hypothetical protein